MTISKTIKSIALSLMVIPVLGAAFVSLVPTTVSAVPCNPVVADYELVNSACIPTACAAMSGAELGVCIQNGGNNRTLFGKGGVFTTITNVALVVIGSLSVIMLIYGGIRYTISAGDAKQVESAKNTIMYAIIGIVVALLAGAIINFVMTSFK